MFATQTKTPVISGRGVYSVRAVEAADIAATALRNTTKTNFEVSRYETIFR